MRKIIATEFVTLDNVMEGPGPADAFTYAGWTMPYGNEDIMKYKADELFACDALLLGRTTYEGFADAWPKMAAAAGAFGEKMNSMKKYVVSTTASDLAWNNSTLIKGDIVKELLKLKQEEGKDILICGSAELIHSLAGSGVIDEFTLLVYPIVLGEGKKLFKDGTSMKLKLVETKTYDTGVVLLRYAVTM